MSLSATKLPFSEQINYFKRKLNLPTDSYTDIYGEEHDYAFVVAGANRNDIIADFREAVDKAINDGTTLEEFRKDFDNVVAKYGWDYNGGRNWRSRIIYDTNLYSSYQAGRYEQQQRIKHLRPYWEYQHKDGQKNPRPLHESWDGLVLHCDDPWWQTHYPINAYGCHCSVISHSASSLKRRGLKVGKAPPIEYETRTLGNRSGKPHVVRVPVGIDPGFERIPGRNRRDVPSKVLLDKVTGVPPELASNMVSNTLAEQSIRALLNKEVAAMVDKVVAEKKARGVSKSVGVIHPAALTALTERGMAPATSVITLRDEDVLHAIRDGKHQPLPVDFWRHIVNHMANPDTVMLDKTKKAPALLYVFDLGAGKGKVIVSIDYSFKVKTSAGKKERITTNIIRSGTQLFTEKELESLKQYDLIWRNK